MPRWPTDLYGGGKFENAGSVAGSSVGTTITASASPNTKGSYGQLVAATVDSWMGFFLQYRNGNGTGRGSIDIAVGAGGSEQIILADLFADDDRAADWIYIPLAIPKGSRLAARCQNQTASRTCVVNIIGIPNTAVLPGGLGGASTYGFTAATTRGITLDCGGSANTDVIVDLINPTTATIKALYLMAMQATGPTANADLLIDLGFYNGTTFTAIVTDLYMRNVNAGRNHPHIVGPFFCNIASGSRLAARGRCSSTDAGGRTLDLGLLALR